MKIRNLILVPVLLLAGCSNNKTLYEWSNYPSSLLSYYKSPGELAEFEKKLAAIIEKGEASGRVPPGMYAEYGYVLLESGNATEALVYFGRERDRWPESAPLMNNLIARISKTAGAASVPANTSR